MRLLRSLAFILPVLFAATAHAAAQESCGEPVTLPVRGGESLTYSLAMPDSTSRGVLLLLPGGGGALDLDAQGCPQKLKGNSLARSLPLFHEQGFVTALVDAPSDHRRGDGLGGFRIHSGHAEDIGAVIADLRQRTGLPVFVIGTSRGTISAVNAAARLSGPAAPDAVVLTSPVTSGYAGGKKAWVAQSVFDLPLGDIRIPILVIAHAQDICVRTPPQLAKRILDKTNGVREQMVMVEGGPGVPAGLTPLKACRGQAPHGFVDQRDEVAAGIARFLHGESY